MNGPAPGGRYIMSFFFLLRCCGDGHLCVHMAASLVAHIT